MWHTFVQWFASVIQLLYDFTVNIGVPNYGLAIILMTILIKLVLFPITHKQLKSMRAMQEIQPRMKQIQERYKEDSQTMQLKIMELYKEHGVNPLGGCLPLLIQMPIFIAFYQSLYKFDFKVAAHAGFLWIPDISKPDPYYILAILAALTTYLQQRVSMVDTKDPTQKSMLYMMPLFMAWIAATMSAGLPLYWVVFNTLGILQQLYINNISAKAKLVTGTGVQFEVPVEEESMDGNEAETSSQAKVAGRDKGGKSNGSPDNRKKRKKR
ncbi:MAG: YidC/Oxa1 family membrane protein insertase [Syntrophomonas sp.]